ncbi:MAG: hypothetical protein H6713_28415 [Myxococcales bacterium]|nr:hypothetical protein [Myxococcales bacterium]
MITDDDDERLLVAPLRARARAQHLLARARAGCEAALISCAADDVAVGEPALGGFAREELELVLRRQALVFNHGLLSYPFVTTELSIVVAVTGAAPRADDHYEVGAYSLITRLDGAVVDDTLALTETRAELVARGLLAARA